MDTGNVAAMAVEHLKAYGPPVLAVALLLSGIGIPLPASLLVIAAGAMAAKGRLSLPLAFVLALAGAVAGSLASYGMGRRGLGKLLDRAKKRKTWRRAEESFHRRADSAIILTRFLITPLALPTNLIAGGERFSVARFTVLCAIGNAAYLLLYGGLGYVFADRWRYAVTLAKDFGLWIGVGAVVIIGAYFLVRRLRRGNPAAGKESKVAV